MSKTRTTGILLFLFIPAVLLLFLQIPFGLTASIVLGVAIMVLHRWIARPFMERHLAARCFWCGCDLVGSGVDASFRSGRETINARACHASHADNFLALARVVASGRLILVVLIFVPVLAYLGNAFLAMTGAASFSLETARWVFKVPIAVAVVGLSFAWPLGRTLAHEPDIALPAHNLSLLGAFWTLGIFRVVGLIWLAQAAWAGLWPQ